MAMLNERLEDLSFLYFIQNQFLDFPGVAVVNAFPKDDLTTPTISVVAKSIELFPGELGNAKQMAIRTWDIDVFAETITQRDEFAYRIINALQYPVSVLDFNMGFPPTVTPSQLYCLKPQAIRMDNIDVDAELVSKFYYRNWVNYTAYRDKL